ncbi:MAG: protein phosphatase 2C domain-containing protein [Aquabacterium sp.]|uniref:PP2C family protein-serine/threonine phosphatase n=1 Tax=Aquabacterium sp. TaxID=1872578 RepID=UPI002717888D|nr:protein phosphatase 2C domain-containing protein [Aquabacterium sp.]MDO9002352.1 protein phosphatase 2C domain-containing protein [Aquabacterium sp.]
MELEIAIISKQGGRSYNEDACGHWNSDRHLCCVMADGAGGHGGGDIASKLAVQNVLNGFAAQPATTSPQLRELVVGTNHVILDHRIDGTVQANMHTTVALLAIDFIDQTALWAHVGDSRVYWFRQGRIQTRTRDHSLVQALADGGLIKPEDMRTHPKRSELQSALGTPAEYLEVGVPEQAVAVEDGDVFLLCTDGLWEYVDDEVLEQSLIDAPSPQAWLDVLEATVLTNAAHKPSHDNFSALTVWTSATPSA